MYQDLQSFPEKLTDLHFGGAVRERLVLGYWATGNTDGSETKLWKDAFTHNLTGLQIYTLATDISGSTTMAAAGAQIECLRHTSSTKVRSLLELMNSCKRH